MKQGNHTWSPTFAPLILLGPPPLRWSIVQGAVKCQGLPTTLQLRRRSKASYVGLIKIHPTDSISLVEISPHMFGCPRRHLTKCQCASATDRTLWTPSDSSKQDADNCSLLTKGSVLKIWRVTPIVAFGCHNSACVCVCVLMPWQVLFLSNPPARTQKAIQHKNTCENGLLSGILCGKGSFRWVILTCKQLVCVCASVRALAANLCYLKAAWVFSNQRSSEM